MKKRILLLLLICTTISYGQTTLANKLKITGNATSATATKVNVQEANGEINTIAKTDLIDVLEYSSAGTLPVTGVAGKIYVTIDNHKIYSWNGTFYSELALTDISGKENISNKASDFSTVNNTLYPSVQAVKTELDLKQPLENQRLSDTDDVVFNSIEATNSATINDLSVSENVTHSTGTIVVRETTTGEYGTASGATLKPLVGLGNVDNTSDANKPVSTATQTALDLKSTDANVIHTTGNETKSGILTLSDGLKYTKAIPYTGDLNDLTEAGFYFVTDASANAPTASYFHISVENTDNNWAKQTATGWGSGFTDGTYIRVKSNPTWSPWKRVWDDGNLTSPTSLSTAQTNTGVKTFLDGTLGLRNVANTFTSYFTNTNTASRTHTLQNRNGILADDTDLALKANDANTVHISGNETITGTKTFNPSVSASGAIARGTHFTPTLTAVANNDELVGVQISPTFTLGAFTGVNSIGLRVGQLGIGAKNKAGGSASNAYISYSINSGGSGVYPFATNGNLVLEPRTNNNSDIVFLTGTSADVRGYFSGSSGNLHLGYTTGTDNGYKLDVNGTSRFTSQITSTLATGTAPFAVASTTAVANLTAANVTTNANLTGAITSVGNATSIASQTGTGTTFAMSASPTFTGTPLAPTATAGTTGLQIANLDFVATAEATNVKLTTNQTVTGQLNFTQNSGNAFTGLVLINDYTAAMNDFRNNSSGVHTIKSNNSSGAFDRYDSATGSTGDLILLRKNGVITSSFNHLGELLTPLVTTPLVVSSGVIRLKNYTVATLPAGTQGDTAYCTDLLTPTYMATAVGGGAVVWKVFFDGTTWKVD